MAEWKRICCAVDFSMSSRFAMEEAAALARKFQAELTVLHVYELPTAVSKSVVASAPHKVEEAVMDLQRKLDVWRADAEGMAGLPVCSSVLPGNPADEIIRYARDASVDLLVLATHGRTGLTRLVLGSVAERIVREAPCPVLVERRTGPAPAP